MFTISTLPHGDVKIVQELKITEPVEYTARLRIKSATLTRVYRAIDSAVFQVCPDGKLVRARRGLLADGDDLSLSGTLSETLQQTLACP